MFIYLLKLRYRGIEVDSNFENRIINMIHAEFWDNRDLGKGFRHETSVLWDVAFKMLPRGTKRVNSLISHTLPHFFVKEMVQHFL